MTARTSYHHGDARNALIAAAANLLERTGAAGLSLRQVAETAGLSRQAPYNHFADKEALLAELVRDGFERLGAAMVAARQGEPGHALEEAGAAYIGFAQDAPALFRLMFSRELVERSRFPQAQAAATASFAELRAIIATLAPAPRVAELTLTAWSLVHGYAMLCIETDLDPPSRRRERAALFARTIEAGAKADAPPRKN